VCAVFRVNPARSYAGCENRHELLRDIGAEALAVDRRVGRRMALRALHLRRDCATEPGGARAGWSGAAARQAILEFFEKLTNSP
jgi:hypothetical protein